MRKHAGVSKPCTVLIGTVKRSQYTLFDFSYERERDLPLDFPLPPSSPVGRDGQVEQGEGSGRKQSQSGEKEVGTNVNVQTHVLGRVGLTSLVPKVNDLTNRARMERTEFKARKCCRGSGDRMQLRKGDLY